MNFNAYPFRTSTSKLAVAMSAMLVSSSVFAADTIRNISVTTPSAMLTELNIDFANSAVTPTAYELASPTRLVLDFPNVNNQIASRMQTYNKGYVNNVTTLTNDSMTRMIIELSNQATFSTRVVNNRLVVSIQPKGSTPAVTTVATNPAIVTPVVTSPVVSQPAVVAPAVVVTEPAPAPVIVTPPVVVQTPPPVAVVTQTPKVAPPTNTMVVKVNPLLNPAAAVVQQYNYDGLAAINFNGTSNGGGNISINLVNDSIPVDVQRMGDELVIRLTGATIPSRLQKQMTVGNGLVRDVIATNQGRNGVIRITMTGDYDYRAFQTGNQLNININPPKRLREPTLEERTYSGAPLSLEFQDVSVRTILEVLAQHTNTNIVASDSVSGNITLRLINVPWDQALDIILKSKNLDKRVNGNVIWVAPAAELAKQEADELKAQQEKKVLDPLRTEYIRLNYAKAENVRTLIEAGRATSDRSSSNTSLLTDRGTVTIDARTNTLIVKDTAETISNIRDLISKIDIAVKQVMIEARIVSATDTFSKELGVKWGILSQGAASNRNLLVGGNLSTIDSLKTYTTATNADGTTYPVYSGITAANNLSVNLGATNAAGSIAFGLLSISDLLLDLELSAMQADNKGEVISSPKVLTADKQTARIMSGTQIPYQEASASGATSTSFVEAALSLEVTPNITPEGRIGMDLSIENGSPTIVNGATAVSKDSIKTNVVVDDGQTVVLGGVFKNTLGNDVTKIPFLGDLPYVDRFFKRTSKTNNKQELLIFVTPKLVNDTGRIN
ncbi:type IV pilus secretin PilQ [Moraxella osloensis]|uniref:Type IV pilus secretin PilQ n=1 Tax=Faucicola osloensis TaxID=34062 RepID=A0AAD0EXT1_FAUOS|nr:type IV pilus secretin family protein [Moraxella osloensis]ATQ82864.1 type IV pilus secretin PilQ [Moraxella osloensis]ATW85364.1 type IV pilus secretin PilQ [Moraxella osloensis]